MNISVRSSTKVVGITSLVHSHEHPASITYTQTHREILMYIDIICKDSKLCRLALLQCSVSNTQSWQTALCISSTFCVDLSTKSGKIQCADENFNKVSSPMNTVHVECSCTLPRVVMLNRSYYHMYVRECVFSLRPHLSIVLQRVASWKLSSTSLLKVLTWRA